MKFSITSRFSRRALFEAELGINYEGERHGVQLGAAIKLALKAGADLRGADLRGADLSDADLRGADLSDADLEGAKWRDRVTLKRRPLFVDGLHYPVVILDEHMQIGCELHTLAEWGAFDNARIGRMDGCVSRRFWRDHKEGLLALARGDKRGIVVEVEQAAGEAA